MQEDWSITRVEIADGLYPSVCATLQVTYDHLAVGVVASFSTIGVLHAIYWQRFISGESILRGMEVFYRLVLARPVLYCNQRHMTSKISISDTSQTQWFRWPCF